MQIGLNILIGIGHAGVATLAVSMIQFAAPHSHLSTATGLAFSARAIGGAFGSAVEDAVTEGSLYPRWSDSVEQAIEAAGLPQSSISNFLTVFGRLEDSAEPHLLDTIIPGANSSIIAAAERASRDAYSYAYHRTWATLIPLVAVTIVAVLFLRPVGHLMTEKIDATVEKVERAAMVEPRASHTEKDVLEGERSSKCQA